MGARNSTTMKFDCYIRGQTFCQRPTTYMWMDAGTARRGARKLGPRGSEQGFRRNDLMVWDFTPRSQLKPPLGNRTILCLGTASRASPAKPHASRIAPARPPLRFIPAADKTAAFRSSRWRGAPLRRQTAARAPEPSSRDRRNNCPQRGLCPRPQCSIAMHAGRCRR